MSEEVYGDRLFYRLYVAKLYCNRCVDAGLRAVKFTPIELYSRSAAARRRYPARVDEISLDRVEIPGCERCGIADVGWTDFNRRPRIQDTSALPA